MTILKRLFTGKNPGSFGGTAVENVAPSGVVANSPNGLGPVQSVLQFRGEFDDPRVVTLSAYAIPVGNLATGCGPITGILTFGSGHGQQQRVEFDIGSTHNADNDPNIGGVSGGAMLTFVCTHCEFSARNDANLLANQGATPIGYGNVQAATVTGSLAAGSKTSNARATRTMWLANAGGGAGAIVDGGLVLTRIPPFAVAYRIFRSGGKPLVVNTSTNFSLGSGIDEYTVGLDVPAPEQSISPWSSTLLIKNNSGDGSTIPNLYVVFFLSL